MASDEISILKICALGSVPELKNQFVRCSADTKFSTNYLPTQGADICTKKIIVNNEPLKLILVDTASQEFFGKLRPSYYRGASAAIILFDRCSRKTFETVPNWLTEFQKYIQSDVPIALVGLITRCEDQMLKISSDEAQALASQLGLAYFESKSTDAQKASEIFTYLAKQVIEGPE